MSEITGIRNNENYLADWNDEHPEEAFEMYQEVDDIVRETFEINEQYTSGIITGRQYYFGRSWLCELLNTIPDERYHNQFKNCLYPVSKDLIDVKEF